MLNLKKKLFLGEELSEKEKSFNFSKFHILPIPLEKTVSYGTGTSKAPEIIINASNQLERNENSPCDFGIYTHDAFDCSLNFNSIFENIENLVFDILKKDKIPVCIGGEHSLTFGVIKGFKKKYNNINEDFGIVQFDAHADLRKTYNGNINSHATVMYKIHKENIPIFQFGVRTQSDEEIKLRDEVDIDYITIDDYRKNIGIDYVEYTPIENFHAYDYISANIIYDLMKLCLK